MGWFCCVYDDDFDFVSLVHRIRARFVIVTSLLFSDVIGSFHMSKTDIT